MQFLLENRLMDVKVLEGSVFKYFEFLFSAHPYWLH